MWNCFGNCSMRLNEMKGKDYNFNQKGFLIDFHGTNITSKKSPSI